MAKFDQDFPITGLSKKQVLVIAFETIKYLGWRTPLPRVYNSWFSMM